MLRKPPVLHGNHRVDSGAPPNQPSDIPAPKITPGLLGAEIRHKLPPLKALTSIRFFAAMYVVIYHLKSDQNVSSSNPLGNFIEAGYTGVILFFVLSGFVLAYNYPVINNLKEFWYARLARIYPVYLVALLLGVAYSFIPINLHTTHPATRLILCLTLLQAWCKPFATSFNFPAWTLSVEAFFYLLFPFLLPLIKRATDRIFVLFCGLYLALNCAPLLLLHSSIGRAQALALAASLNWSTSPLIHLPVFIIGACLGATYTRRRIERNIWLLPIGIAASIVLLIIDPSPAYLQLRRAALVLAYSALIYGLASIRSGVLTNRWMLLAGEISYSIYILQALVFRTIAGASRHFHLSVSTNNVLAVITLLAVSYVSYRVIELPARIALRTLLSHKPVALIET